MKREYSGFVYGGQFIRTRLEARWAVFFDLTQWKWAYDPYGLSGWGPAFRVEFPCRHSECAGSHSLLIEVRPYSRLEMFTGHEGTRHAYGRGIPADAGAVFGNDPSVTAWEMAHGSGGGEESIARGDWIDGPVGPLWVRAGQIAALLMLLDVEE